MDKLKWSNRSIEKGRLVVVPLLGILCLLERASTRDATTKIRLLNDQTTRPVDCRSGKHQPTYSLTQADKLVYRCCNRLGCANDNFVMRFLFIKIPIERKTALDNIGML
jgi:hypothetical protein